MPQITRLQLDQLVENVCLSSDTDIRSQGDAPAELTAELSLLTKLCAHDAWKEVANQIGANPSEPTLTLDQGDLVTMMRSLFLSRFQPSLSTTKAIN
jgi:hypothetical protein